MHELSLSRAILDAVVRHAEDRRVNTVELTVGALRQVVPSSLEFYWGIVTRDSVNQWTVVSGVGSCPSVMLEAPGAARIIRIEDLARNRTLTTNLGRYNLPFKMTLTRQ